MRAIAAAHDARVKAAAQRRRRIITGVSVGAVVAVAVVVTVAIVLGSSPSEPQAMAPVAAGAGCGSCHSIDGSRREGPTWEGLAGSTVPLSDGTVTVADADYLRRAIEQPSVEVRQGYTPMPDQGLTPEQVDELVRYITGLG